MSKSQKDKFFTQLIESWIPSAPLSENLWCLFRCITAQEEGPYHSGFLSWIFTLQNLLDFGSCDQQGLVRREGMVIVGV
jgi:hypothetical protein